MIKRIYIDNFKCFTNFEVELDAIQLLLGPNGSGKSAIFDVLVRIRDFAVYGVEARYVFGSEHLNFMNKRQIQTFGLDIAGNNGLYTYAVTVEHSTSDFTCRLVSEEVRFDNQRLFFFDGSDVHLHDDDSKEGPVFPSDASRSALSAIPDRNNTRRLSWFKYRLSRIHWFAIEPANISSQANQEVAAPSKTLAEFCGWFRTLLQSSPDIMSPLFNDLHESIDGFVQAQLRPQIGEKKALFVSFRFPSDSEDPSNIFDLTFNNLSEGQKCLFILYTVLHCVQPDQTFCIDEPDNYLSLREMQPWLMSFLDKVNERNSQCMMISHHPEFIDQLAAENGLWLSRETSGVVRAKRPDWDDAAEALSISELIARGWEE